MAVYTMKNEEAAVTIDEHASEIHSFTLAKTGFEYMWNGDPRYWSGRNPTLFPMVGKTWDDTLHINGKEYHTGNHGFARHSDFTCIHHDDSNIVMQLKDSEETLKQYPFHFTMTISYHLEGAKLSIRYEITNDNGEVMPFNFGLHPAFNCPSDPAKKYEDYHIDFNAPETFTWKETYLAGAKRMSLHPDALSQTIIIHHPDSDEVSLNDGSHGVKVHFTGFEWLAFWSPHAPFVCIEPWYSHTDFEQVKVPFEKREGTQFLQPHDTFHAGYDITVF